MGLFAALANTRARMKNARQKSDDAEAQFAAIEEALILADAGVQIAEDIVQAAKKKATKDKTLSPSQSVQQEICERLQPLQAVGDFATPNSGGDSHKTNNTDSRPRVIMMMGVNGGGKTTTIAKLCRYFADRKISVLLAAADTFRAAAREQLQTWAHKLDVAEVVTANEPGAAAYNAVAAAQARGCDVVLIDTAGRLPSQDNLMKELGKIQRAADKALNSTNSPTSPNPNSTTSAERESIPHDNILILDATTGRNAVQQIAIFSQAARVSGLIVSKLDGSAKAGFLLEVAAKYPLPLWFVGTGESAADLHPFVAADYAASIVE